MKGNQQNSPCCQLLDPSVRSKTVLQIERTDWIQHNRSIHIFKTINHYCCKWLVRRNILYFFTLWIFCSFECKWCCMSSGIKLPAQGFPLHPNLFQHIMGPQQQLRNTIQHLLGVLSFHQALAFVFSSIFSESKVIINLLLLKQKSE